MPTCLIALGSNVDASEEMFRKAMQELERHGAGTLAISRIVTTRPVGSQAGSLYLNAAATVDSHLNPIDLLRALHQVESAFGRTRDVHWGPRTLDLDLLLYGEEIIDQPDLVVPHPAMWYRRFVLDPANEVAESWRHPILNTTVGDLCHALRHRPLRVSVSAQKAGCTSSPDLRELIEQLGADSQGLQWLSVDSAAAASLSCFARVVLQDSVQDSSPRTQPRNAEDRSIIVESKSDAQAYLHLRNLAAAILG